MSALPQPVFSGANEGVMHAPADPSPKPHQARQGPVISPRLLRTADAGRYLGIGEKAIRQLILDGELPYVQLRPGNSPFLLDIRDLDKFIERSKFTVGKE